MMKENYEPPALTVYGSVVSLTMGMSGSTPDGNSGMGSGNQSGAPMNGGIGMMM